MGASIGNRNGKLPEPEINVTPLVDVVLVLLIIFMVVTPAIHEGESIDLPEVLAAEGAPDQPPIDVTLARNGRLLVDKTPVADVDALEAAVRDLHAQAPRRRVVLNADTALPYRTVRETFTRIQALGIQGVSLKVLKKKTPGEA